MLLQSWTQGLFGLILPQAGLGLDMTPQVPTSPTALGGYDMHPHMQLDFFAIILHLQLSQHVIPLLCSGPFYAVLPAVPHFVSSHLTLHLSLLNFIQGF